MLTNSRGKKPGPKEVSPGSIYGFAHQAYWGFRFLSEKRKALWRKALLAKTVREIRQVGKACSQRGVMTGAGYGAAGLMTWLNDRNVARQILAARHHRRYPDSERPSSQDRRMIALGIAVAAGVWKITYPTALRKLAQSGLGPKYLTREVHHYDRLEEAMKLNALVWAEPVENYFFRLPNGRWEPMKALPCPVPANFQGGFIIHGYGPNGPLSVFSRTLPVGLSNALAEATNRIANS